MGKEKKEDKKGQDGNVTVFMFEDRIGAENFLDTVMTWQDQGLFTVQDAVTTVRGVGSDVEVKQSHKFGGKYAGAGAGIGFVAGLLLGGPIGGLAVGAVIGGITGAMKDYGINDKFIAQVDEGLVPNTSALFLMTTGGEENEEQILAELRPFKIKMVSTTLAPEMAAKVTEALSREE
jgi:uncharacterized membrane protein